MAEKSQIFTVCICTFFPALPQIRGLIMFKLRPFPHLIRNTVKATSTATIGATKSTCSSIPPKFSISRTRLKIRRMVHGVISRRTDPGTEWCTTFRKISSISLFAICSSFTAVTWYHHSVEILGFFYHSNFA